MAKVYYNVWHISLWFTPMVNNTPDPSRKEMLSSYEVGENLISNEITAWTRWGFEEDEFAMESNRRYLDRYVAGHGAYTIVAELLECEEEEEDL